MLFRSDSHRASEVGDEHLVGSGLACSQDEHPLLTHQAQRDKRPVVHTSHFLCCQRHLQLVATNADPIKSGSRLGSHHAKCKCVQVSIV